MTDFSGGSWRSLITGDTVYTIPDSAIDYFEDGNLNNYEGDLDAFSITSNPLSGQYSLLMNSDPFVERYSLSGLDNYPVKGDIVRYIAPITAPMPPFPSSLRAIYRTISPFTG